jgi:DNA-binding NarL/FixJ family response regulator
VRRPRCRARLRRPRAHPGARVIRVLLADDQALVRGGFRSILGGQPDLAVVAEAADGVEALEQAARTRPDVVVMDVRMPRMDGIDATREIATLAEPPAVLVLTTFDVDEHVYDALRAGASGFLLKDAPPEDLVTAIRIVANGDAIVAPSVTRRLLDRFATRLPSVREAAPPRGLAMLTERELEVLRHVARGLSNAEIAAQLVVSETTIKTHVGNLLAKLGLRDRVQAVVFAYETGLIQPGQA